MSVMLYLYIVNGPTGPYNVKESNWKDTAMAIMKSIRSLVSNWDAKKRAWNAARKVEAYKSGKPITQRKDDKNRAK